MKNRKWLRYLVYIITMMALAITDSYINKSLSQTRTIENYFLMITITTVINIIIGAVIGFEQLINENQKQGIWKIDLSKLILFGVPAILCILYPYLMKFGELYILFSMIEGLRYFSIWTIIPLARLLLGYCVITSFYKKNLEIPPNSDTYSASHLSN